MTVESIRSYVSGAYVGDKWRNRVALMEDRQVIAIYRTMCEKGFPAKKKPKAMEKAEQISMMALYPDVFGGYSQKKGEILSESIGRYGDN